MLPVSWILQFCLMQNSQHNFTSLEVVFVHKAWFVLHQCKKKKGGGEGGDIRKQQISEAVTSRPSASLPHPEDRQRKECWHMPQLLPCAVRWPWLHRQATAATPLWPKKFRHFWRQSSYKHGTEEQRPVISYFNNNRVICPPPKI